MSLTPHYTDDALTLYHGDCLDVLRELPDASVDAVVTDPPYGLEFMGKEWDSFRIDDPGTSRHRGEHAGTHGGLIEKNTTNEAAGKVTYGGGKRPSTNRCTGCGKRDQFRNEHDCDTHARWVKVSLDPYAAPPTMLAFQEWCRQWSTECLRVLKPGGHMLAFGGTRTWHRLACAVEDAGFEIRDSIAWLYGSGFPKSLNVAKAIASGSGRPEDIRRLNLGEDYEPSGRGRVNYDHGAASAMGGDRVDVDVPPEAEEWQGWGTALKPAFEPIVVGRKPLTGTVAANVLAHGTGALNVDGCRVEHDEPQGKPSSGPHGRRAGIMGETTERHRETTAASTAGRWPSNVVLDESQAAALDAMSGESVSRRSELTSKPGIYGHNDSGGASRFFYTAKAPSSERVRVDGTAHPTVKPLDLMRWLIRLVTPPDGTVLEPFAGSGTTVEACILEGVKCVAIEREADYLPLIESRIARRLDPVRAIELSGDDPGLFALFDEEPPA